MSVENLAIKESFSGNGSTTTFSFSNKVLSKSDLVVKLIDSDGDSTTQVLDTDYTVSLNSDSTADVEMSTAPASGETLFIIRELDIEQTISFANSANIPEDSLENGLDKSIMLIQQLQEQLDRALMLGETSTNNVSVAEPSEGKGLVWDADGNLINTTSDIDAVAIEAEASATAAASSATAAASSATTAAASETAAATSETNASTSETNAAASASAASTSETNAAASETNAATSATNAAASASAAATSETNAAASETAAEAAQTAAETAQAAAETAQAAAEAVAGTGSIGDLLDVDTSTDAPTTDQALVWDGSNWVPGDVASGGEEIACRYTTNAGQVITGATATTVVYEDVDTDTTGGNYNTGTGIYTVGTGEAGWYCVTGRVGASVSISTSQGISLSILVNGSYKCQEYQPGSGYSSFYALGVSDIVYLEENDTVELEYYCNAVTTLNTGSHFNTFSIVKVKG